MSDSVADRAIDSLINAAAEINRLRSQLEQLHADLKIVARYMDRSPYWCFVGTEDAGTELDDALDRLLSPHKNKAPRGS